MTNSFLQHSLGSDQVSDNVKSLFPSSSTATATAGGHEEYRGSPPDLLSRTTSSQPQELCLTLQSNQHNIFTHLSPNHQGVISSAGVPAGWPDHGQRMPSSWHANAEEGRGGGNGNGNGNGDGYMFAGIPPRHGLDQSQLFSSHGEPLQSSGGGWPASARAWLDPLAAMHHPSQMSGQIGFSHLVGGGGGGFMGFLAPAAQRLQLQGEEEEASEVMRRD
jgi:hypothetical protein